MRGARPIEPAWIILLSLIPMIQPGSIGIESAVAVRFYWESVVFMNFA